MLSLSIHHNIHLTKQQRYDLHESKDVITVGVSVPIWYNETMSSEPGKEVFCNYYLKNPKKEIPIHIMDDGYEIAIPYREGTDLGISDEEWRHLNMNDPDKLKELYKNQLIEVSSKNLLDIKDGGNGGTMNYREHNKIKKNDQYLNIMHYVCIEPVEILFSSLTF